MVQAAARVTFENVHHSRSPCCWESSGDFPSILEWSTQVLLQLVGSVVFISLSRWASLLCLCLQLSVFWTRGHQTWDAHSQRRIFVETPSYGWGALSQSLYNHLLFSQENRQDPPPSPFYRKVRFPLWRTYWVAFLQEDTLNEKPNGLDRCPPWWRETGWGWKTGVQVFREGLKGLTLGKITSWL